MKCKYLGLAELSLSTNIKIEFQTSFHSAIKIKSGIWPNMLANCTPGTRGKYLELLSNPFLNCKIHTIL